MIVNDDPNAAAKINASFSASFAPVTLTAPGVIVTDGGVLQAGNYVNGGASISTICATTGIRCYSTRAAAGAAESWPATDIFGNPCCAFPYMPPPPTM